MSPTVLSRTEHESPEAEPDLLIREAPGAGLLRRCRVTAELVPRRVLGIRAS